MSLCDPPGPAKANQRAIFVFQAWARNDSRKAQPGLMELCLCCASKPTFGHGARAAFLPGSGRTQWCLLKVTPKLEGAAENDEAGEEEERRRGDEGK